jgi:hypothetical protein
VKNEELVSLKVASTLCPLGVDRLRTLIREGKLKAVQPSGANGKLFVLRSEIDRMMQLMQTEVK